jgi:hypothetical protein
MEIDTGSITNPLHLAGDRREVFMQLGAKPRVDDVDMIGPIQRSANIADDV